MRSVLFGHESREEIRLPTLVHLAFLGITPEIVLDGSSKQGWPNVARLVAGIIDDVAKADESLLLLEDDLEFNDRFPELLRLAQAKDSPVWFYLHETDEDRIHYQYPKWAVEAIKAGESFPTQLVKIEKVKHLYGSQCVYFPSRLLKRISEGDLLRKEGRSPDAFLWRWFTRIKEPVYVGLPMSVQHAQDERVGWEDPRPHLRRKSISFDLPTFREEIPEEEPEQQEKEDEQEEA